MALNDIFSNLKKSFTLRKKVDFDEEDIHIDLETPTALEEIKITEACQELEGASYIEGLKKHSLAYSIKRIRSGDQDIELTNDMELESVDEEGNKETLTKYLYMLRQLESWPSSLRDVLFDAFSDLQNEVEERVKKGTKFERFQVIPSERERQEEEPKFKKVEVPEEDESDMTEVEKMSKRARQETEDLDTRRASNENEAVSKYDG